MGAAKTLIAIFSTGVVASAVGLTSYAVHLKSTAEHLRDEVSRLTVGESTYDDAQRIAAKYRRFEWHDWRGWTAPTNLLNGPEFVFTPDQPCSEEHCAIWLRVDNRLLSRLHVARPAQFVVGIAILNGRVVRVDVTLVGGGLGLVDLARIHGALIAGFGSQGPSC